MNANQAKESGAILIGMLVVVTAIAGLATVLLTRSHRSSKASTASVEQARLLFVAEAGLNYNFVHMQLDPKAAAKDTTGFTWNATTSEFDSDVLHLQTTGGTKSRRFRIHIQYRDAGAPISFADRASPSEAVSEIRVTSTSWSPRGKRSLTAFYAFRGYQIGGAIVSDMLPAGPIGGNGRNTAQLGHIAFTDTQGANDQFHVYGDILANGTIAFFDSIDGTILMDETSAQTYFGGSAGALTGGLAGTDEEIPDLTTIGSAQQLFDFDRFVAAAAAGAGQVYPHVAAFEFAMAAANASGDKLEGITVIHVDLADTANNPDFSVPINISGTFIVRFADGTDPTSKIRMRAPININAADLATVQPTDETTFTTGYPATYTDPSRHPSSVDISPAFANFATDEDLPAMMYNNGVLDIHDDANICGVVYGASFLEIENKDGNTQYFNGAIFSGGGIWFDSGSTTSHNTMIRYDSNTVDNLKTMGTGGETLVRTGYAVSK